MVENPEVSGDLTAVPEVSSNWPELRDVSEKNLVIESRFMANFMLAATPVFSKLVQTLYQLFLGFYCLLNYT